jgi:hypothetical protein
MTDPRLCCGKPPIIFTGKSAFGKPVHSVTCLMCGRHEISGCKGTAITKFNKGVKIS